MATTEVGLKQRHCKRCGRELYSWTETTPSGMKVNCGEGLRNGICGDCGLMGMVSDMGGVCIEKEAGEDMRPGPEPG